MCSVARIVEKQVREPVTGRTKSPGPFDTFLHLGFLQISQEAALLCGFVVQTVRAVYNPRRWDGEKLSFS